MTTLVGRTVRTVPARHPEWWVYAVAAAAGFVVLVDALAPDPGMARMAPTYASRVDHWLLMVLVMMLPLVAPQARVVALRSLWHRRHRAAVGFVVGHVVVWLLVGAGALVAVAAVVPADPPWWVVPAALALAALWQVSAPRRRLMRRCGSVRLHDADGAAADRDCLRLGVRAGGLCVVSCGVAMVPMAVDPMAATALPVTVGVLAILLRERASGPNPATRPGRPHEAVALLALAVLVAVTSALG